ncbi:hypothetical protein JA9_001583 [Meyerozyma sp. JA9]|nr:hypothetical protein JA9_001583 [Meyerozyma sp. JA9]
MITRVSRCFKRPYSLPSHFSNPSSVPPQYGQHQRSESPKSVEEVPQQNKSQERLQDKTNERSSESSLKELSSILAMCALAYIAIDNYNNRIRLEKLNNDSNAINLKTLQLQQANFLNAKKKQDMVMIEERKETNRRNFKMALHIALLRKQLKEAGIEPLGIEDATREYESSVRADSSVKHVSGQVLWLDDSSGTYIDSDETWH